MPLPVLSWSHRAALRAAALLALVTLAACSRGPAARTEAQQRALLDTLSARIAEAYDPTKPDPVARAMALYPQTGRVVSAAGGRITTERAALERDVRTFWENVGRNMRSPRWEWGERYLDVLGPDAAVLTASYRIPHLTPAGEPHAIGGVWTAVFARRDGRWVIVQEHLSDAPQQTGIQAAPVADSAAHHH
ncbi:MAG: YybH family protein [Gemmatimonadaceae bacterium]